MTCECGKAIERVKYSGRGPRRFCDDCRAERRRARDAQRARERRASEDYKAKYRADEMRRKYGLTQEGFDARFAAQGGACAICRSPDPRWYRGWHIDHDHETGIVRGILCHKCNLMIGLADDDPERLRLAATYLDEEGKPEGWQEPDMSGAIR